MRPLSDRMLVVTEESGSSADARRHEAGHAWPFEDPAHRFPHFGLNVHVLQPGEPGEPGEPGVQVPR